MSDSTVPGTPDALAADVARQRDELAETVEELQARLDVRARLNGVRARLTTADGAPRPELLAAAAVGVSVVVGLVVLRRRRSR